MQDQRRDGKEHGVDEGRVLGDPARHRLMIKYAVPDLWISPDLVGHEYAYSRLADESRVTIQFPSNPADFIPEDEVETVRIPALRTVTENGSRAYGVNVIQVTVTLDGAGTSSQKLKLGDDMENMLHRITGPSWQRAIDTAERETQHFLSWFRTLTRQTWLGLAEEPPTQYGRAHLFDAESGVRLISYGPQQTVSMALGDCSLSIEASSRIARSLASGTRVPVSEALLADAEFLQQGRESVDSHRAVLAAAIASEIQLKSVLRDGASPGNIALVSLALTRQSDIGVLSSTVASAILGRNLKHEDPELHKRLRRLASERNRVVHEGASIHPNDAHSLVTAARELFDWLQVAASLSERSPARTRDEPE